MAPAQHPPRRDRESRFGDHRVGAGGQVAEEGHRREVEHHVHDDRDCRHPGEEVLAVDRIEHGGERRVDEQEDDPKGEYPQRRLGLGEEVEQAADRVGEDERAHADRPAEQHQDLEEALIGESQPVLGRAVVNGQDRVDHRLQGQRHELERLERLVCELVPAHLLEASEEVQDRNVDPEVDVGEEEAEREREGELEPAPKQAEVEGERDPRQPCRTSR